MSQSAAKSSRRDLRRTIGAENISVIESQGHRLAALTLAVSDHVQTIHGALASALSRIEQLEQAQRSLENELSQTLTHRVRRMVGR